MMITQDHVNECDINPPDEVFELARRACNCVNLLFVHKFDSTGLFCDRY